jgi:predicted RNA-binding protein
MFAFMRPALAAATPVAIRAGEQALSVAYFVGLSTAAYFVGRKTNQYIAEGYSGLTDNVDRHMERRLQARRTEKRAQMNEMVQQEIARRIAAGELRSAISPKAKPDPTPVVDAEVLP